MPAPASIGLALVLVAAATAWAATAPAWAGPAGDRIERFREIAVARLSVVEDTGGALDPASQVEIDALLDGEVLHSLRVGGPFASIGFIHERLDAFSEVWGGVSLRIEPLGGGVLVGRFRLSAKGVGNSVRLDGPAKGKPALLRAWQEDGVPEVYPWPGTAVVAAAAPLPDGRRAPWSLWWSRGPSGWRLTGAAPVLQ